MTGAHIDHVDSDGCSAMHRAAEGGNTDLARLLHDRGISTAPVCAGLTVKLFANI